MNAKLYTADFIIFILLYNKNNDYLVVTGQFTKKIYLYL